VDGFRRRGDGGVKKKPGVGENKIQGDLVKSWKTEAAVLGGTEG